MVSTPNEWQREARRLLRVQMALADYGPKELSRALEQFGLDENPKTLSNKINRGTFTFAFFLQCMRALGADEVKLR